MDAMAQSAKRAHIVVTPVTCATGHADLAARALRTKDIPHHVEVECLLLHSRDIAGKTSSMKEQDLQAAPIMAQLALRHQTDVVMTACHTGTMHARLHLMPGLLRIHKNH